MTMYLEHFGLREAPFRITPHTEFFFAGANRGATLEALVYAITAGEGLVKVTGEVGTGKTMLCRVLMERLPEQVETIYLAVPSLTRDEMLIAIATELGIDTHGANTTQLIRALQSHLIGLHAKGRQVVALIDEAHAMPLATLEEIRLLSNLETATEKLLQIVLFGQPELDQHLNQPNMRQLKERITHSFLLEPLPPRDIKDYINFRLRAAGYHGPDLFGPEALQIIAEASEGLTRRINIYADKTMLAAFAAGTHTVTADHARAAVTDTQILVAPKPSSRRLLAAVAGTLVAGVAIGYGVALVLNPAGKAPGIAVLPADARVVPAPSAPPDAANSAAPPDAANSVAPPDAANSAAPPDAANSSAPAAAPGAPMAEQVPAASSLPEKAAAETAPSPAPGPSLTPSGKLAGAEAAAPERAETRPERREERATGRASPIDARLAAGLILLEGAGGDRLAVQLMMTDARERGYLESYLAEASRAIKPEELFLYPSGSEETPKLGVLYGTFATRREATSALEGLPAGLRRFRPYVRPLDEVRRDVRQKPVS